MNYTIAILLASYNGEDWLDEQLWSIRGQSYAGWHLFVRDDDSQDGSRQVVARHAAEDPRITVLPNAVRSGSAAANFMAALLAIDLQAFDFVAFSDQDDIWAPCRLAHALEQLALHGAEGYSCDLVAFDNGTRRSGYVSKVSGQRRLDYLFQGASAGCTYVLTRKAAQHIAAKLRAHPQGMAVDKSHDWLIYAICRSHGLVWRHEPAAQVFYRQHGGNVYGAMQRWDGALRKLLLARSGWYRAQMLWNGQFLACRGEEQVVLERLSRFGWRDRLWLACRARAFRRDRRQALVLAVLLLFGLV